MLIGMNNDNEHLRNGIYLTSNDMWINYTTTPHKITSNYTTILYSHYLVPCSLDTLPLLTFICKKIYTSGKDDKVNNVKGSVLCKKHSILGCYKCMIRNEVYHTCGGNMFSMNTCMGNILYTTKYTLWIGLWFVQAYKVTCPWSFRCSLVPYIWQYKTIGSTALWSVHSSCVLELWCHFITTSTTVGQRGVCVWSCVTELAGVAILSDYGKCTWGINLIIGRAMYVLYGACHCHLGWGERWNGIEIDILHWFVWRNKHLSPLFIGRGYCPSSHPLPLLFPPPPPPYWYPSSPFLHQLESEDTTHANSSECSAPYSLVMTWIW